MSLNNKTIMECEFGGRPLKIETGRMAKQADGSVVVHYGNTMVLVTATSAKSVRPGQGFFPLTVDYIEKYYAAGKFPGGFFKREARPSAGAILSARLIDRPIRPLFPEGYMYDTHIHATVLSVDEENDPDIAAAIGASAALTISDIPFNGPIGEVRVGRINGEYVANPSLEQMKDSDLELLVAASSEAVVMVEGEAHELPEDVVLEGIMWAFEKIQPTIKLQKEMAEKIGRPTREFEVQKTSAEIEKQVLDFSLSGLNSAFAIREKLERYTALGKVKEEVVEKFVPEDNEDRELPGVVTRAFDEAKYRVMRDMVIKDKKRLDGRDMGKIRPIECEAGILPRTHGSGLFTRGETQVLSVVTLGTKEDEQAVDNIRLPRTTPNSKKFMLHYNFPPFSVGETGPLRPPGRREIGHGTLAERALQMVAPTVEDFPYTIRIVAETLESNGSSSMGSVCSGCLAMMDAGVPIKKPVAGIAMGLIQEGDTTEILSDILGDEDHLGDMDFKVAGTADGVTAIQMDIKIAGVTREILERALTQAKEGRLHILGEMMKTLDKSREDISEFAPRVYSMKVAQDKIAAVIGTGGKVIRSIIEECNVKVDINDDGTVNIASLNTENARKAQQMIESIVEEVEIDKVYNGKVVRVVDFGAFVAITPSTEGLLHISEIAYERVQKVEDYLKEGDEVEVKVLDIDRAGKVRLSRKVLLDPPEGYEPPPPREFRGGGRGGGGDRGGRGDRSGRGGGDRGGRGGRGGGRDRSDRNDRDGSSGGAPHHRRH